MIAGLLIGLSLGAGAAWTASTTIHDAQFKVLDAVNKDLHRQVTALEADKTANEAEMTRLREQLSLPPPATEVERSARQSWRGLFNASTRNSGAAAQTVAFNID